MKRRRTITLLLAIACLVMAGVTLRQFHVPLVGPVTAQSSSDPGMMTPHGSGPLKPASASVRKAATAAIRAQLTAFQKNDYEAAVKFQSSNLRKTFPSVSQFRQMITTAYPEFAHYKSVQFNDVRADAMSQHVMAQVTIIGQDGVTIKAIYMMVRESNGYKVDGVVGGGRAPSPALPGGGVDA